MRWSEHRWRRDTAAGTFPAEGRDGCRMEEKETRFLPDLRDQFVQVIGGGRTAAGIDPLVLCNAMQQTVFPIIDQFAFLPLLDRFDDQAQLFADLVVRLAV